MADLSITAANVLAGADSVQDRASNAGETIIAGKTVYKSSTTKKWMLADTNSATAEARRATGISLNAASLDQPLAVHKSGKIAIGATVVPGTAYFASETPGGIQIASEIASLESVCQIGLAASATEINVDFQYPGVTL